MSMFILRLVFVYVGCVLLPFLFSLYICDFSVFTFCGVLVYVTLYCVAALLA